MTLDEKREVITVLLCGWRGGCFVSADWLGVDPVSGKRAARARQQIIGVLRRARHLITLDVYALAALEAAYLLIESSPTLVREWFGGGEA